jgi:hypothetical protein
LRPRHNHHRVDLKVDDNMLRLKSPGVENVIAVSLGMIKLLPCNCFGG